MLLSPVIVSLKKGWIACIEKFILDNLSFLKWWSNLFVVNILCMRFIISLLVIIHYFCTSSQNKIHIYFLYKHLCYGKYKVLYISNMSFKIVKILMRLTPSKRSKMIAKIALKWQQFHKKTLGQNRRWW